jgi:hypothetical protein
MMFLYFAHLGLLLASYFMVAMAMNGSILVFLYNWRNFSSDNIFQVGRDDRPSNSSQ